MKVSPYVSLLVFLLGGWLAACAAAPTPTPAPCDDAGQTAVTLTLLDKNDAALDRVQVSYRVNDGAWQDLPERVNGRARIPGGGGGYEIRAEKPGYQTGETAVTPINDQHTLISVGGYAGWFYFFHRIVLSL